MNEYTSVNSTARLHDANGNLVEDFVREYDYDAFNRLVEVRNKLTGVVLGSYAYDHRGRRIYREADYDADGTDDEQVAYYYLGGTVVEETDSTGTPIRQYVWGGGLLQFKASASNDIYCHENGYGSLSRTTAPLSDGMGGVIHEIGDERDFDGFGGVSYGGSDTGLPYTFRGMRADRETNFLVLGRGAMFNPALGRFATRFGGHARNYYSWPTSSLLRAATIIPQMVPPVKRATDDAILKRELDEEGDAMLACLCARQPERCSITVEPSPKYSRSKTDVTVMRAGGQVTEREWTFNLPFEVTLEPKAETAGCHLVQNALYYQSVPLDKKEVLWLKLRVLRAYDVDIFAGEDGKIYGGEVRGDFNEKTPKNYAGNSYTDNHSVRPPRMAPGDIFGFFSEFFVYVKEKPLESLSAHFGFSGATDFAGPPRLRQWKPGGKRGFIPTGSGTTPPTPDWRGGGEPRVSRCSR